MISVVIPTLNEERALPAVLDALRPEVEEILVADGGSVDRTATIAEAHGARLLRSPPGRGPQQHAGAQAARGDLLWFLHADSRVPRGAGDALRRAARVAEWGCFETRVESRDPRLRWTGFVMSTRARATGSCTGDMGLWMRRGLYERLGGFAPLPALEDLDLSDRARAVARCHVIPLPLGTSARRWEAEGVNRTVLRMLLVRAGYRAGLDPAWLVRAYRPPSPPSRVP